MGNGNESDGGQVAISRGKQRMVMKMGKWVLVAINAEGSRMLLRVKR